MKVVKRIWMNTIVFLAVLLITGCTQQKPVKIGFSAQLTGRQAELGVQQRNGVMLAVEEINENGGINGREIELIIKDDLGTPEGAVASDTQLIEEGVVCIIGHATSTQTLAGLPVAREKGVLMMSPTASTAALSGKDDNFFRIIQSLVERGQGLAEYVCRVQGQKKLGVYYDTVNEAYVASFWHVFSQRYEELGGVVLKESPFSSKEANTDFDSMILEQKELGVEAVLIIGADTDTALIAQRIRIAEWDVPLYSSAWAQTDILIKNGGKAVEGMVLEQSFPLGSDAENYLAFMERFSEMFGKEPAFSAAFGYETMYVLAEALKETEGEAEGLKDALLGIKDYTGLIDTLSIDAYGDVIRPYYLGEIKNAEFIDLNLE